MSQLIHALQNANQKNNQPTLEGLQALKIKLTDFEKCYTYRDHSFAVGNSGLVSEIAGRWTDRLKGTAAVEVTEIYLDPKKIMRVDTVTKHIYPVPAHELPELEIGELAVSRAIAKISAKGFGEPAMAPAIAININERGFELAWGHQVSICQNFNILNVAHRWNDYEKFRGVGSNKVHFELSHLKGILKPYMEETAAHFAAELAMVEQLSVRTIDRGAFQSFMGQLFVKIEYANQMRAQRKIEQLTADEKYLPVTSRQLAAIAVESVHPNHPEVFGWRADVTDVTDVWNLINWGSEVLKAQKGADMATMLRNTAQWTGAVIANFMPN